MLHQSESQFELPDTLTEVGALLLADRIRRYWRDHGRRVPDMRLEHFTAKLGVTPHSRGGMFGLRSDMLNGLPRKMNGRDSL
jgi:hypothetical protein